MMAFEVYNRKFQPMGDPALTFTTNGRISFNKAATAIFEKKEVVNVLLLWDKDKRLIGIKPITKKDPRAYKVHYGKRGNGCGFSATTFLRHIGYAVEETQAVGTEFDYKEQMFIAEIPENLIKKENKGGRVPIKRRVKSPDNT